MARDITIKFLGDEKDLTRSANKVSDDLDRVGKRAGVTAGVVGGVTSAVISGVATVARGTVSFISGAVKEAEESVRIAKVTAQIIKTTGGAANVSAKHVDDYATSLSNVTGIDDELIAAADNILLTFKQVRNETGKGNKIFDRATTAAADLSAVLGTDMKASALQLGKALSNPTKGVTALQRAGVNFTDAQRKQIKTLQAHNDILGAQKIILDEVEHQVGGAAEANATATEKMATAWGNFKEAIGTAILPAFNAIVDVLINTVLPAILAAGQLIFDAAKGAATNIAKGFDAGTKGKVTPDLSSIEGIITTLGEIAGRVFIAAKHVAEDIAAGFSAGRAGVAAPDLKGFEGVIVDISHAAGTAFDHAIENLKALGQWAKDNPGYIQTAAAALAAFGAALATIGAIHTAGSAITSIASAFGPLIAAAPEAALVIAIIAAIAAAAFVAYKKIKPFHDAVDAVGRAMRDAVSEGGVLRKAWDDVASAAETAWGAVRDAVLSVVNIITPIIGAVVGFLIGAWQRYGDEVSGIVSGVGELIAAVFGRVMEIVNVVIAILTPVFDLIAQAWNVAFAVIRTTVGVFIDAIQQAWALWGDELIAVVGTAFNVIKNVIEGALRIIQGVINILTGIISGDWSKAWEGVKRVASGAWQVVKGVFTGAIDYLKTTWSAITSLITTPFTNAKEALDKIMGGFAEVINAAFEGATKALKDSINALIAIMNAAIKAYNRIPLAPNIPEIPEIKGASAGGGATPMAASTTPTLMSSSASARALTPATASGGGAMASRTFIINLPEGVNGHSVIDAVRRYEGRNGRVTRGWQRR